MSTWLSRIATRLASTDEGAEQAAALDDFFARDLPLDAPDFWDELLGQFSENQALAPSALCRLLEKLSTLPSSVEHQHTDFWLRLASHTGSAQAWAAYGDVLLQADREDEALSALSRALMLDPRLADDIAGHLEVFDTEFSGESWLAFRLDMLKAWLAAPSPYGGEQVRELYSGLLEEFSEDHQALSLVRELGKEIEQAITDGLLPRSLVARGPVRD